MTEADFVKHRDALLDTLVPLLMQLDLDGVVEQVEQAERIGPKADPELFERSKANLRIVRKIANAGRAMQATVRGCADELTGGR